MCNSKLIALKTWISMKNQQTCLITISNLCFTTTLVCACCKCPEGERGRGKSPKIIIIIEFPHFSSKLNIINWFWKIISRISHKKLCKVLRWLYLPRGLPPALITTNSYNIHEQPVYMAAIWYMYCFKFIFQK